MEPLQRTLPENVRRSRRLCDGYLQFVRQQVLASDFIGKTQTFDDNFLNDTDCFSSELVSCGADKSVVVWDVSDGRVKRRLRQHAATVNCVKYNEDSSVVVSGSNDNTVCCWDIRSRNNSPIQVLYLFQLFIFIMFYFNFIVRAIIINTINLG